MKGINTRNVRTVRNVQDDWQGVSAFQLMQAVFLIATFGTILGVGLINAATSWATGQKAFQRDDNEAWLSGYLARNSANSNLRSAGRIG